MRHELLRILIACHQHEAADADRCSRATIANGKLHCTREFCGCQADQICLQLHVLIVEDATNVSVSDC